MHMVTYRSTDGSTAHQPVDSLEDAARFVEQLTNEGRGTEARIFAMTEVPIAVKTYYKVEFAAPATEAPAAAAAAPAPAPAPEPAAPAPAVEAVKGAGEPVGAGAGANGGRFGLFSKA